ncbi:glycosyltransferase [Clostridium perfringens]|nr:glycosyltransferase [Clostridium perfringens]MDM0931866.1 glycosyltransferase [Clostridium perfringens]MDU4500677.1 glycosyltransferase [Clostridium perfringens]
MLPKVSIIVPIYKVERYINKCLDSIINQSYKNIEIILVDDGSPDNCGKISDNYAKKDSRIKSLHKENGGLSDARNYGMKYATGDYILFVDSDDWLKRNFVETLVNIAIKSKADIVQSGFYYTYEDHLLYDDRYYSENMNYIELNTQELMKELVINERVKNFAWGKLYKKSLINDIPFKKGVLFEDVFWAHKVMDRVNKYIICHKPMYYYLQRNDSIVSTYTVRNLDIVRGLKERHIFIEKNYSNLVNESYKIITKTILLHYYLLSNNKEKDLDRLYRTELRNYIIDNYKIIREAISDDKELKIELDLFRVNYSLSRIYVILNKILRKLKIKKQYKYLRRISL